MLGLGKAKKKSPDIKDLDVFKSYNSETWHMYLNAWYINTVQWKLSVTNHLHLTQGHGGYFMMKKLNWHQ